MSFKKKKYYWNILAMILVTIWILILFSIGSWLVNKEKNLTLIMLRNEARTHFLKDQAFRSWAAGHGGVYVPVSERTTPSPYLSHIVDRDIVTEKGKVLTLMNPAWVLRQLMEDYDKQYGIKGHITSLNPIRKENSPDEWERMALESFGEGIKEVEELSEINGETYLRFMSPMITIQSCLKCHAEQGYKVGDIRGGVSVSVPGDIYFTNAEKNINNLRFSLTIIGLIGFFAIIIASYIIQKKVNERETARDELKNAQNYISSIIDSMPAILIGLDKQGIITHWNLQAEKIIGKSAGTVIGLAIQDAIPRLASDIQKINKSITTGQIVTESRRSIRIDDKIHYENMVIYPLISNDSEGVVIYLYDITPQVEMEEIMIQSDKMLSVGGLAAGMAHEINNPLAGIIQTLNVMSKRLSPDNNISANLKAAVDAGITLEAINNYMENRGIHRMISSIKEGGKRVAVIVENMLNFVRLSDNRFSSHRIDEILDKTLELAESDYNIKEKIDFKQIDIKKEYSPDLPLISCNKSKIQQVFLNILHNGSYAMNLETSRKSQFIIRTKIDKEKNMIIVEIEDNGPGMKEDVKKRIFEPFYTTKEAGSGTGLGLSLSYFIITESHKGEFLVRSKKGVGTCFIIRLPFHA